MAKINSEGKIEECESYLLVFVLMIMIEKRFVYYCFIIGFKRIQVIDVLLLDLITVGKRISFTYASVVHKV